MTQRKVKNPFKTGFIIVAIILSVFVGLILIGIFVGPTTSNSSTGNVYITNVTYHYFDPQTGNNWTYTIPANISIQQSATASEITPFTSNNNCTFTFQSVYALTQGFNFSFRHLPLTFYPNNETNMDMSITAPNHSYNGSLNVEIVVTSNC